MPIQKDSWDAVLVGDGSGSGWNGSCGWACLLFEHDTQEYHEFYGAATPGAIGFGEIMPYMHALAWYHAKSKQSGRLIHVVTDSQYVATTGKRSYKGSVKANRYLWSMFDWFKRQGTTIKWHWMPRESTQANKWADTLSRSARINLVKFKEAVDQEQAEAARLRVEYLKSFGKPQKKKKRRRQKDVD